MGCAALVGWFSAQRQALIIAPAAIFLWAIWYAFYRLRRAIQSRCAGRSLRENLSDRTHRQKTIGSPRTEGFTVPAIRRRFLYVNPDTGEEVFKYESA
jgi:hypothetical protein